MKNLNYQLWKLKIAKSHQSQILIHYLKRAQYQHYGKAKAT